MNDIEKAIEISKTPAVYGTEFDLEKTIELQRYNAAMLMAQWKQEQMIEYLYKNIQSLLEDYGVSEASADIATQLFLANFKQAMKGE